MSVGIHVGVDGLRAVSDDPASLLSAINHLLRSMHLQPYTEPADARPRDLYAEFGGLMCLGRAALDHGGASTFAQLGRIAAEKLSAGTTVLEVLEVEPVCLLPIEFRGRFRTKEPEIVIASSYQLVSELTSISTSIGVNLEGSSLSDAAAQAINDAGEDLPDAWLTLYEAARQSISHQRIATFA